MFGRFSKKPISVAELGELVIRQVKKNAQVLMHRQVYFRYVEIYLVARDFAHWSPFKEQLLEQLGRELAEKIPHKDGPYRPELRLLETDQKKTYVTGGF